ncbi:hypothetical protein [Limnobacter litoralis]|uniref:Uncharacterized protein n=1 Tax=Limnobacter litoralis TaxID=481366 RepID=A0ABQ5YS70_9BURK|nr:hypothetical protein [Limnobacter litoralis]GLR26287.1 hypothetical protein GCM10007875_13760 [Limnobacter litoralis]
MATYFLTSIPPKLSRVNKSGLDIGESYQTFCIQSWSEVADFLISFNSENEFFNLNFESNLHVKRTSKDAKILVGRPLVFLSDFIDFIKTLDDDDLVILGNADVFFLNKEKIFELIKVIENNEVCAFRRLNLEKLDSVGGESYAVGLDVFLSKAKNFKLIDPSGFVFGEPWWDHFIAVFFLKININLMIYEENAVGHLIHPEKWNRENWTKFGEKYLYKISISSISKFAECSIFLVYLNKAVAFLKSLCRFRMMGISRDSCFKFYYLNYISSLNVRIMNKCLTHLN